MSTPSISFTSLGLVVLDEIRFPSQEPLLDVLGGSGTYGWFCSAVFRATLGARLFLRPPLSRTLGWMIHTGHDFPELMTDRLRSWDSTLIVKREADKPSTRGLLENTPLLSAKAYHYLETPQDMQTRLSALLSLRNEAGEPDRPFIVWEPAPYVCKPENLQPCLSAAQHVDVLSPNHLELAALFGESPAKAHDKATIEALARRVLDSGVGIDGKGTVVVRAGENGSVVVSRDLPPTWLPPFYPAGADGRQHSKVVDPTGAGNAFLGAYVVGYLQTQNAVEAACYGTVGGSFALEQVGMPELVSGEDGELWNGADAFERLREYRKVVGL
ncbi:carbohydrate kinase pfkB [Aspergillus fumigatus]|nr:carbohydrate kinase pfkB [Aspergillus fumigatus]